MKIRMLPITIIACCALIVAKSVQVTQTILAEPEASQQEEVATNITPPKLDFKADAKPLEAAKVDNMEDVIDLALAEPAAGKEEAAAQPKEEKLPPNVHEQKPKENIPQFNETEKEVLSKLAARRAELDEWQKNLEIKEQLLEASSKKVDNKLNELKKLKAETENLLATYESKEDAKIKSLVKVYENMKPKDAAAIFEEMDMPILLEIAGKMSERKVSPILAEMTAKKAKDVTELLAKRNSLPTSGSLQEPKQTASVQ